MKKLRSILSALATLRRVPSAAIASAWDSIKVNIVTEAATDSGATIANVNLIDSIIGAVVSLAKDDEDKAAAPGKADKPAS